MTEKARAKERKDGRENAVIHPLTIGSVSLANNLILGPMAGVSDLPFRLLCHERGLSVRRWSLPRRLPTRTEIRGSS